MFDKHDDKKPCKWGCGQSFKPAGKTQHEKFCLDNPKHADVAKRHRTKFQTSKAVPLAPLKVKVPTEEQEREDAYVYSYVSRKGAEIAFRLFPDDVAMFRAVSHLLSVIPGPEAMSHLQIAREMIDLKIKNLEE